MDKNMIDGVIRAVVPAIIAYVVGKGLIPAGDYGGIVTAIVGLISAIWSIHSNVPQVVAKKLADLQAVAKQ